MTRGGISIFQFQGYKPGSGADGPTIEFPGYIVSLSDQYSPLWGEQQDIGRSDPKMIYQQFARDISLSFYVVAEKAADHEDNELQLAELAKLTYPIHQVTQGFNGMHVLYKIGKIQQGYGIITSLVYDWDGDVPWIQDKPIYTPVAINIRNLADVLGNRPDRAKSKIFNATN